MKILVGKEEDFKKYEEINSSGCSARIKEYVVTWANLMEAEIEKGKTVAEVADATAAIADYDGITLSMHNSAVGTLSIMWEHGEELRQWHNKEYNYSGSGTVNGSLISVKKPN